MITRVTPLPRGARKGKARGVRARVSSHNPHKKMLPAGSIFHHVLLFYSSSTVGSVISFAEYSMTRPVVKLSVEPGYSS